MKPPVRTKGLPDRFDPDMAAPRLSDTEDSSDTEGPVAARPVDDRPPTDPGLFELEIPGIEANDKIRYLVQLPPEYDANRKYPAVVTLHAAGASPEMQIDWWAGGYNAKLGMRLGQASRQGYIVIAPVWTERRQTRYQYSAQEHAAVLYSLRDATQRLSIDTDRVFLSGHSLGGDAAWDIGLAHPDLWAGVIPVCAVAEYDRADSPKYVSRYWENGRHVAFYFVGGAFDGNKIDVNSRDWNRYLQKSRFDTTVVEYLGRGHEHFQDEIQRIFQWMSHHVRNFSPTEFKVNTMRPWDRFFWWLEADGLPAGAMILPAAWPARGRPAAFKGRITEKKNVLVTAPADHITLWLSPEIIDLDGDVKINVNGKLRNEDLTPSTEVMLEDARQRGDRAHAFWVKIEIVRGARRG